MSTHIAPFTYIRLGKGEIRLLFSTFEAGEVVYNLETVQLQDHTSVLAHDALSYTWGDLSHTFPIICSGRTLQIHKNLHEALPFLARRASPRPIWIDAICINQSDEVEKNDQVRTMHQIYRVATEVWVWLGCGMEHTAEMISLLPQFIRVSKECAGLDGGELNDTPESQGLPPLSSPVWDAFYSLLHHKWFCRLWIVQEAALARSIKVLCGRHEIAWADLDDAMDGAESMNKLHDANRNTTKFRIGANYIVFLVRSLMNSAEERIKFSVLSSSTTLAKVTSLISEGHDCYDPRDRVFGVVGLVDENTVSDLGLVYEMDLTELYTKFTRLILTCSDGESGSRWSILNMATFLNKTRGLPSWCPDFHRQGSENCQFKHSRKLHSHGILENHQYSASKRPLRLRPGNCPREIVLSGRIVDTIDRVFRPMPEMDLENKLTIISALKSWVSLGLWERNIAEQFLGPKMLSLTTDDASPAGEDIDGQVTMYWRTLVGNLVTNQGRIIDYKALCDLRKLFEVWAKLDEEVDVSMQ